MSAVADWFAPEAPTIERLRAGLGSSVVAVGASRDLDGVHAEAIPAPSVHVYYGGYRPLSDQNGIKTRIEQTWIAAITVAHATDARAEAGPLVFQAASLLAGWPPAPLWTRYSYAQGTLRPRYAPGRIIIPLAFTTTTVITGEG